MKVPHVLPFLSALVLTASALPQTGWLARVGEPSDVCLGKYSHPPSEADGYKYSRVLPVKPRIQWDDAGGYCGSMSVQNVAMAKGVWLSQQQVRDHTSPGGGHDEEILATNIDEALRRLKLDYNSWDYKTMPTPQLKGYLGFLKQQLVSGNPIAWMIMLEGGRYPVYPGLPFGFYSHVEPVYGVYSKHPLSDPTWYDDDIILHGTDAKACNYYRRFDSLGAGVSPGNVSECGSEYLGYPCVYTKYGFGWAISGPADSPPGRAYPASLAVDHDSEPDTRAGQKPVEMKGTVTVTGLTAGKSYALYRWNSVATAYNYTAAAPHASFTASGDSFVYQDPESILSSSATYYRCVERP